MLYEDSRLTFLEALERVRAGVVSLPEEANYSNLEDPGADPFYRFFEARFNSGAHRVTSPQQLTLDNAIQEAWPPIWGGIDILKVDVDGNELDVLQSGLRILDSGILAVEIEVQFQGYVGDATNSFGNVDRVLRQSGFTLLDLKPVRYGRAALPQPFLYPIPANTKSGQVFWADAVYFRDLVAVNNRKTEVRDDARKLVVISSILGFPDIAAELILEFPRLFDRTADSEILDVLALQQDAEATSWQDLIDTFVRDTISLGWNGAPPPAQDTSRGLRYRQTEMGLSGTLRRFLNRRQSSTRGI